ncbi:MAG: DAK2 domain-containing protein [Coriobacteriia bacterium]|nr:DAK2 domain-containing protein [Coriobacteriia bacterium]
MYTAEAARRLISIAAAALKSRTEEINQLNVFPVPDGDTGINMSFTMDTVVQELSGMPGDASIAELCHAVSHGSLMGARGNSGVILSQILRGLCEEVSTAKSLDVALLASSFERAVAVAFQAVRKPVEGTMLTVIRDTAQAASAARDSGLGLEAALESVSGAAFASVRRTPELLPVLAENGVVDAGGFGLAILIEGFVSAALGRDSEIREVAFSDMGGSGLHVEPTDDWDDSEYQYCTEFLLFGADIDSEVVLGHVSAAGGSELVVGADGEYKVHVHTNDPGGVLSFVTQFGEVAEVHIHNMRRQSEDRDRKLRAGRAGARDGRAGALGSRAGARDGRRRDEPLKPVGFVAVASGDGLAEILMSLGVDLVVRGGQTMNPSTEDLISAIEQAPAESVIVLPNNKNIILAATAAALHAKKPAVVVPTRSIPAAFTALLVADGVSDLERLAEEMTHAADGVRTGEVTHAIKDAASRAGAIKAGQVIGIVDDKEIEVVGEDIGDVALRLAELLGKDAETLSLFAGADCTDEQLEALTEQVEELLPDVEVEAHWGGQPLYPVIMSAE